MDGTWGSRPSHNLQRGLRVANLAVAFRGGPRKARALPSGVQMERLVEVFLPAVIFFVARGALGRALGLRARRVVVLEGPRSRRALALFGGAAACYLFGVAWLFVALSVWGVETTAPEPPVVAQSVLPGQPAEEAGIRAGDEIVAVDGRPVRSHQEVQNAVAASGGRALRVETRRDGGGRTLVVTPRRDADRWRIGVAMVRRVRAPPPLGQRVLAAFGVPWYLEFDGLRRALSRSSEIRVVGPLGIARDPAAAWVSFATEFATQSLHFAALALLIGGVVIVITRSRAASREAS